METPLRKKFYQEVIELGGQELSTGKARDAFIDAIPLNVRGTIAVRDLDLAFQKEHRPINHEEVSYVNSHACRLGVAGR